MKRYKYLKNRFLIEHTITNIFALIIIFFSVYHILKGNLPILMTLALISSLYSVINNFIYKVNTETIIIGKDEIAFESYNKKDNYRIEEIKQIKLKEYPTNGKIYVRLTDKNNTLHRYWIHTRSFENGKELFKELMYVEFHKHPNTLKAKSRAESFSKTI